MNSAFKSRFENGDGCDTAPLHANTIGKDHDDRHRIVNETSTDENVSTSTKRRNVDDIDEDENGNNVRKRGKKPKPHRPKRRDIAPNLDEINKAEYYFENGKGRFYETGQGR
jgi:hypothetical protein